MERRNLGYVVIVAMFISGLYVAISGFIADVFGFPQFALHSVAGYACAALTALHLALNWGRVTAYLGQRLGRRKRRERPASSLRERTPQPGRRQLLVSAMAAAVGFVLGRLIPSRQPVELPSSEEAADVGALYHQWSELSPSRIWGAGLDWGRQPERYKTYTDVEQIALPDPHFRVDQGLSLEEAIEARRSIRDYSAEPLSSEGLSRLLHAAQGITERGWSLRAAPSAGALYPIELYPVVHSVVGLEPGVYHYVVQEHGLELLRQGDFRVAVTQAGLWQDFLGEASVCFVLAAIFQRTRWKYRERTYRYVLLEAGHIGQNLYLAATSMGMGACAVGAFLDDELNDLLGLDGKEEAALYVVSVGGT